ncbi:EF-hand domain-containing protein [Novipirellula artificiosorum]|uniref:Transaldolase/EF-hand domain-containing protein n=1 Tax=Novipirellula artificiosorum TaxID=2528016 RepID=A0A5C6D283_9BACT|nr:hypothetical protein [Novipirellula artificiosorum]TWU30848.1 transaldolase/EF-hand domain-containing protein [Novipirellula artificiosorum]
MRNQRFFVLASALLIGSLASVANAQPGGGREGGGRGGFGRDGGGRGDGQEGERGGRGDIMRMLPVMAALDSDSDGVISADEIKASATALKSLDKNNDGTLTEDELRPQFGGRGAGPEGGSGSSQVVARMMAMDKDGDGKLSNTELTGRMRAILIKADQDKDGYASKEELETMAAADSETNERTGGERDRGQAASGPEGGRGFGGRGPGQGGPGQGGPGQGGPGQGGPGQGGPGQGGPGQGGPGQGGPGGFAGPPNPEQMLGRAFQYDADNDGKLSKTELAKMFSEMGQRQGAGGPGGRGPR